MPLNIDPQQILLHLFNFVLLLGILYFLLYKPVKDFMAKRQKEYEELDKETEEKLKYATEKELEYQKLLDEADEKIRQLKAAAHKDTEDEASRRVKAAEKEAADILAKARKDANNERDRIVKSADKEITGLVTAAARKMIFTDTDEAYEKFLETLDKNKQ